MKPKPPCLALREEFPVREHSAPVRAGFGRPLHAVLVFALLCLIATGCGKRPRALTGEVLFEGQPVSEGSISLVPDASKGTVGAGAVGVIKDGHFSIPAKYGVFTGFYHVTVASEENLPPPPEADPSMMQINPRFPVYEFEHEFQESDKNPHMKIEVPSAKDR